MHAPLLIMASSLLLSTGSCPVSSLHSLHCPRDFKNNFVLYFKNNANSSYLKTEEMDQMQGGRSTCPEPQSRGTQSIQESQVL